MEKSFEQQCYNAAAESLVKIQLMILNQNQDKETAKKLWIDGQNLKKLKYSKKYASGLEVRLRFKIEDYAKARAYDNYLAKLDAKSLELQELNNDLNNELELFNQ